MGYFEGLAAACFKIDEDGKTIFYPLGVLAKGRVLPDKATEARVRQFVIRYYKITLPITILLSALNQWLLVTATVLASFIWFYVFCQKTTSNLPISNSKLTFREGYTGSAQAHNKTTLWLLFLVSVIFVLAGILLSVAANSIKMRLIALASLTFFGLCSFAIGFMLRAKYKFK
jgi:hypothetical protein